VNLTASDDGKWRTKVHNTLLVLGDADTQIRLEALQLDAILAISDQLHLGTEFSTTIQTSLRKQQLPQFELTIKQQGKVEQNSFSMEIKDTAESVEMDVAGTLNLETGSGDGRLSVRSLDLPHFSKALITPLGQLELLHPGMEILAGSIELDTTFKRADAERSNWTQQSQLKLHGLSGRVDDYHFEKLALLANWSGVERWKTVQPVEFSLEMLDMGFEVHNIVASITLPKATSITKPSVRLAKFSAGVFGGRLLLPEPALWDFGAPINTLTLRAQQWQLSDLVALQQDEDIQASGMLEGELPVTLDDGRIVIKKGYLRALPPGGSIRYSRNDTSRALGNKSTEVALALDLLSDFQYQVLSSTVDLDKAGNLQLGLSLAGHNPTLYEGRPVNFNINLEQNLDPLLQSLRLSDKLVKKIEKRLQ
jgi:Dicarboxylate transport